jgi:hypothetical protein
MPPLSKSHDQTNFPFLDMQYNKARDQILIPPFYWGYPAAPFYQVRRSNPGQCLESSSYHGLPIGGKRRFLHSFLAKTLSISMIQMKYSTYQRISPMNPAALADHRDGT